MIKNHDLVTIIIPIKNSSEELKKCLESIKQQSYRPIEIIINDSRQNPSQENEKTSNKFNKSDLKILFLRNNESMAQARRQGFFHSKGKYILHADADMTLSRNVLKDLVKNISHFDALIIPENSVGEGFWTKCKILERSCYVGDDIVESARFFKRDVYEKVGYHDDTLVFSEDKDLDLRIRQEGYKVGRISSFIYHHEEKLKLTDRFLKMIFYGQSAERYIKKHPFDSLIQANVFFRPAFFRHWKDLAKHPILTLGIFTLKCIELTAVIFGIIYGKISNQKPTARL